MTPQTFKKKMTVTMCTAGYQGTNVNGEDYTLYEIAAIDESGAPIEQDLKSFEALPLGELHEYKLSFYEKNGKSNWTVSKIGGGKRNGGGGGSASTTALKNSITELAARVTALEQRLGPKSDVTPDVAPPAPAAPAPDDDDIPF